MSRERFVAMLCVLACALGAAPAGASHGTIELVSGGNGAFTPTLKGLSEDGTKAFFQTNEQLVPADTDTQTDVYERSAGTTKLVSTGQLSGPGAFSQFGGASADGSKVFFDTIEQLDPADTDTTFDVYERSGGATTLLSTGTASSSGSATFLKASADGTQVFFQTAEQLVPADTDTAADVYRRAGGVTTLESAGQINGNGSFGATFSRITPDGNQVLFFTDESLVAADTDGGFRDVYLRSGGVTTLVSAASNQAQTATPAGMTDDGSRIFFFTRESHSPLDTDGAVDVYERSGGGITLISAGQINGNGFNDVGFLNFSGDGSRVFFQTDEQLAPSDTDSAIDAYERSGGVTTHVSTGPTDPNGSVGVGLQAITADGTRAFFQTTEAMIASDTNGAPDVYERSGGNTVLAAGQPSVNGTFLANGAVTPGVTQDGARLFFITLDSLVAADTDTSADLYERAGGVTTLVSTGPAGGNGSPFVQFGGISTNGARVFMQTSEQLTFDDTDSSADLYVSAVGSLSGYPRPKSASPVRVSLVPAFQQCTNPNRTHGPSLEFPSCNPPAHSSGELTVGSPDANGQAAGSIGSMRLAAMLGDPTTAADEADVSIQISITDVRRKDTLADYTGSLRASIDSRITGRDSDPDSYPATTSDADTRFDVPCAATGGSVGATCSLSTTMDAVIPGAIRETKRTIWGLGQLRLSDAGADGNAGTDLDNQPFAKQGIFVP